MGRAKPGGWKKAAHGSIGEHIGAAHQPLRSGEHMRRQAANIAGVAELASAAASAASAAAASAGGRRKMAAVIRGSSAKTRQRHQRRRE